MKVRHYRGRLNHTKPSMRALLLALAFSMVLPGPVFAQSVPMPAAITVDGVPPIPAALADTVRPYLEYRSATFLGWNETTGAMLISTRFGNSAQLHTVSSPGAARQQISFEAEPVPNGRYAPGGGTLLVSKDSGGNEFYQIYTLADGRLRLLTDGKSRNTGARWSRDGKLVGYSSTRRNGKDSDLYLIDPAAPASDHLLAKLQGGGWSFTDFSPSGKTALVSHSLSIEQSELYEIELASGALSRLSPMADGTPVKAAFEDARYASNGEVYVKSDLGSDFLRLGTLTAQSGFTPLPAAPAAWDIEEFEIAKDGSFVAAISNEAGISRLRLLDPRTGSVTGEPKLPLGILSGLTIAPWGEIGITVSSATSPDDAWSVNPKTLAVTRWTHSETGGLDASKNRPAELVTVKSFDGVSISGFLTTPDPARFPGKRPLIINIHGGPEGQSRPAFLGRNNFLVNELGLAIFYPNVRGSTGYGKRFVSLDNGPFHREDSVKDIGAFLDALTARPDIDKRHVAETGGSYGGYMCYASAIFYGSQLKAAQCTVAIANFVTFLENTQDYRRDLRRVEYGDERDPVQRAQLLKISPITRANELKIPLFVVTGGNDPRVPPSEPGPMIAAVRANGTVAWHMIAANEGHGYRKKENQDYQFLATTAFWQQTLLK